MKKFLGSVSLGGFMDKMLEVLPSKELSEDDTQSLWNNIINPPKVIEVAPDGEIDKWNYTLDEAAGTVTISTYLFNTDDDNVIIYGRYKIDDKIYDTKIGSNTEDSTYRTPYMFNNGYRSSDTNYNSKLKSITFNKGIDTSELTNMHFMFNTNYALTQINGLEYFDTSNVTNMNAAFSNCKSLSLLDLRSFDTSKVTDIAAIFYTCTNLAEIKVTTGKWVIKSGCNTTNMFKNCGISSVTEYPAA